VPVRDPSISSINAKDFEVKHILDLLHYHKTWNLGEIGLFFKVLHSYKCISYRHSFSKNFGREFHQKTLINSIYPLLTKAFINSPFITIVLCRYVYLCIHYSRAGWHSSTIHSRRTQIVWTLLDLGPSCLFLSAFELLQIKLLHW